MGCPLRLVANPGLGQVHRRAKNACSKRPPPLAASSEARKAPLRMRADKRPDSAAATLLELPTHSDSQKRPRGRDVVRIEIVGSVFERDFGQCEEAWIHLKGDPQPKRVKEP